MKRTYHSNRSTFVSSVLVFSFVILAVVTFVILGIFLIPFRTSERFTIVVASSPFQIVTINTTDHTASIVKIPEDFAINGAFSLGTYPIASYWKMGSLDVRDHSLLSDSVRVSLGIPVDGYMGYSYERLFDQSEESNILHEQFTLTGLLAFVTGHRVTNLSLLDLVQLYKYGSSIRPSDIKFIDLGKSMSTTDDVLPDGSIRKRIDFERTDVILKNIFVYPEIRKEALTIGVRNSAGVPELAASISRQLMHTGMFVVSVSSGDVVKEHCEITGNESSLSSKTAEFIQRRYYCIKKQADQTQREDLVMNLGSDIGSFYVPRRRK